MSKVRRTFPHKFQDVTVLNRKIHTYIVEQQKITLKKNWMKLMLGLNITLKNLLDAIAQETSLKFQV
jgi:hypothetical protein